MELLTKYKNGNCIVAIYTDGTKIREYDDVAQPAFPESIDLKIINVCERQCAYCHEESSPNGQHASLQGVVNTMYRLPAGVEIAIGGGNPFLHPDLLTLLMEFKARGYIANITVNARDIRSASEKIAFCRQKSNQLITALGISYHDDCIDDIKQIIDDNTVVHFIAGVDKPVNALKFNKVLVLGFKKYGRAKNLNFPEANIKRWKQYLPFLLHNCRHIAFDNLALEQLNVRQFLGEEKWQEQYMGDDGQFTMYIDAVKMQYAKSSISDRKGIYNLDVVDMFQHLRKEVISASK